MTKASPWSSARHWKESRWDVGEIRTCVYLLAVDTRLMTDEECESAWLTFLAEAPETIL